MVGIAFGMSCVMIINSCDIVQQVEVWCFFGGGICEHNNRVTGVTLENPS